MNETLTCALGAMDTVDLFVALGGTAVATAIVVANHVGHKYMRRIEALSMAATSIAIIIRAELTSPGTIKANAEKHGITVDEMSSFSRALRDLTKP